MLKYSLLILIIGAFFYFRPSFQKNPKIYTLNINEQQFKLESATTLLEKSKGLSNRSSLCPNCGMIFIYQKESFYPFWMKDTLIPLDIIWLDKNGKVVDIKTGIPKCPTPLSNQTPAQYIIELNSGAVDLEIDDIIKLPPNL